MSDKTSQTSLADLIEAFRTGNDKIENQASGGVAKLKGDQRKIIAKNLTWLFEKNPSLRKQFEQAIQDGRLEKFSFFSLPKGKTNINGESAEAFYVFKTKEMAFRIENLMLNPEELAKNADFLVFVLGHEVRHANQPEILQPQEPNADFYQQSGSDQAKAILNAIELSRNAEVDANMNGWNTLVQSYHDRKIKVVSDEEYKAKLLQDPSLADKITSPQQIMDKLAGRTSFKRAEDYQFNSDGTLENNQFNPDGTPKNNLKNFKKVNEQFFELNSYANMAVVRNLNNIKDLDSFLAGGIVPANLLDHLTNNDKNNLNGVQLAYLLTMHKTILKENIKIFGSVVSNCQKTLTEALEKGKTADLTDDVKDFFDRAYSFEAKKSIAGWNEAVKFNEQYQKPKLSLFELAQNLKLEHVLFDAKGQPKPGLGFDDTGRLTENPALIDAFKTNLDFINPDYKAQLFAVYVTKNSPFISSSDSHLHIGVDHDALGINQQQIQKMIKVKSSDKYWLNTFDRLDLEYTQPKEKSMPEKSPDILKTLLDSINQTNKPDPRDFVRDPHVAPSVQEKPASRDFYEELLNPGRLSGSDLSLPSFKPGVGLPPIFIKSDTMGRNAEVSLLPAPVTPHSRAEVTLLPAFPSQKPLVVVLLSDQVNQAQPNLTQPNTAGANVAQPNTAQFAENTLNDIINQGAAKQHELSATKGLVG